MNVQEWIQTRRAEGKLFVVHVESGSGTAYKRSGTFPTIEPTQVFEHAVPLRLPDIEVEADDTEINWDAEEEEYQEDEDETQTITTTWTIEAVEPIKDKWERPIPPEVWLDEDMPLPSHVLACEWKREETSINHNSDFSDPQVDDLENLVSIHPDWFDKITLEEEYVYNGANKNNNYATIYTTRLTPDEYSSGESGGRTWCFYLP